MKVKNSKKKKQFEKILDVSLFEGQKQHIFSNMDIIFAWPKEVKSIN